MSGGARWRLCCADLVAWFPVGRPKERATLSNIDTKTVAGFGDEWTTFDQSALSQTELMAVFEQYFAIFPWEALPQDAVGFDLGCGSGRWAKAVAARVGTLHC